jgi:hypothetical protein
MALEMSGKLYVVVEMWRGLVSNAQVFANSIDADACAEMLRKSINSMEDEVTVIETTIR